VNITALKNRINNAAFLISLKPRPSFKINRLKPPEIRDSRAMKKSNPRAVAIPNPNGFDVEPS